MVRHSQGNAAKNTKRCPHCGTENVLALWERILPGETRVAHSCLACGQWIVLDPTGWQTFWS
ncbi:zinc ribbon domain-containing protein [Sulfobacillus thermosulfidooxidans]|uniref:zinc ribbon domain-containing protein n=1 Tax=Sulfobacillus thermosulfidooxidans TaxID=28034 RepID=UPI000A9FC816|nr:zinc ribbon domain-containing protein [Sulfobacillus thermosulfidooxidans]